MDVRYTLGSRINYRHRGRSVPGQKRRWTCTRANVRSTADSRHGSRWSSVRLKGHRTRPVYLSATGRSAPRASPNSPPQTRSGGIGLERLALVCVLETESLRWLCRARISKIVDLARHLRVCLASLKGLRRLSINFIDNFALKYVHESRRWV